MRIGSIRPVGLREIETLCGPRGGPITEDPTAQVCVFVYDGGPWPTLLADDSWQLPRVHHSVVETGNSRSITPDGMGIRNEMPLRLCFPDREMIEIRRGIVQGGVATLCVDACCFRQWRGLPVSVSYCMLALARTYIIYVQIKVINNKRGRRVIVITSISILNMQDGWMSLLVNNERELLICHR